MIDSVKICGIPHRILFKEDAFGDNLHFGQIDYGKCEISINKDIPKEVMEETLTHEILHGILIHLGYDEKSQDEQYIQALANAIYQTFTVREGN